MVSFSISSCYNIFMKNTMIETNMQNDEKNYASDSLTDSQSRKLLNKIKRTKVEIAIAFAICVAILGGVLVAISWDFECDCNSQPCFCGFYMIVAKALAILPIIISMALAAHGLRLIRKLKKQGIEIPRQYKILGIFVLCQILIIVVFDALYVGLRKMSFGIERRQILSSMQTQDEELIASCYSGDTKTAAIFAVNGLDYPIFKRASGNKKNGSYEIEDNSEDLKRGKEYDYSSEIQEIFGKDALSLLSISRVRTWVYYENYGEKDAGQFRIVRLGIILPVSMLNNNNTSLQAKLEQIANKYASLFSNEEFHLNVYFMRQIIPNLFPYYYALISDNDGFCVPEEDEIENEIAEKISLTLNSELTGNLNQNTEIPDRSSEIHEKIERSLK